MLSTYNPDEFASLQQAWSDYSPARLPFQSHAFISAWLSAYKHRNAVVKVAEAKDGSILFGLPMEIGILRRIPLLPGAGMREVTYAATSIVPRIDLAVAHQDPELLTRQIDELLCTAGACRLRLQNITPDGAFADFIRRFQQDVGNFVHISEGRRSPYVGCDRSRQQLDESLSKATRYWLRRSCNRLQRAGSLKFSCFNRQSVTPEAIAAAFAISASSWKGPVNGHMGATAASEALYRTLFSRQPAFEDFWLWLLYLDEQPVAMQIHAVNDGTAYLLRSDFDEGFRELNPGVALLDHILSKLCSLEQLKVFDLCGEAYSYKQKIASGYISCLTFSLYRSGPISRLARLAHRLKDSQSRAPQAEARVRSSPAATPSLGAVS